jgi:hypothetical protein
MRLLHRAVGPENQAAEHSGRETLHENIYVYIVSPRWLLEDRRESVKGGGQQVCRGDESGHNGREACMCVHFSP